ncbi:MAG: phage portal protein [Candidatus Sedimenticola sp. (ex Thyasira tokunagai)]
MAKKSTAKKNATPSAEMFTFGDPTPVLDARDILGLTESYWNGEYYEPPYSRAGLAKSYHSNTHHSSAIQVKRNILVSTFKPHTLLSRSEFSRFVTDYLIFADGFIERINNRLGKALSLKVSPSKYTRRGKDDKYFYVPNYWDKHEFKPGSVFHLMQPDINQEIYGAPDYLSSLHSAWLNEAATLFRRKYYLNGNHAGFILYMTDAANSDQDVQDLRKALKESKGPGNFKNAFMYAPNGKKDGIQVIPISEVQAKDEFFNIKNVTRDDVMAGHRVPWQVMSTIPTTNGGTINFGDAEKVVRVFNANEIAPMQECMKELNDWLGEEVIKFDPYIIEGLQGEGETKRDLK